MIAIIDIDSVIPNLALKKIEKFYLDKGAKTQEKEKDFFLQT